MGRKRLMSIKLEEQAVFFPEDKLTNGNEKFCAYLFRLRDNQIPYTIEVGSYEYRGKLYQRKIVRVLKSEIKRYKKKFPDRLGWLWEA